jgi:hypothetical protein
MRYIRRQLEEQVLQTVKGFPAVVLTGPRRAARRCCCAGCFPRRSEIQVSECVGAKPEESRE